MSEPATSIIAAPSDSVSEHDQRFKRITDCVNLQQPDRMPAVFMATFWLAKYAGMTCKELMYDYEKTKAVAERAVLEFEPDAVYPMVSAICSGRSLEAIGFKQLQWPGHGVGENMPFQYLDREYMFADEYDEFLFDPTGFYLQKYLPRVAEAFEGLAQMPSFPGLHYFRLIHGIRPFAQPGVRESFEKIIAAAEEVERFAGHSLEFKNNMAAQGYPLINGTTSVSPYDMIADYFRGATGMMKDLYRNKDKLLALLDKVAVINTRQTIEMAKASGHSIVMIPVHWAGDAFMSPKQFEMFWWPPFRKMMLGLIDAGLTPMPLWEADCTKRLETIADIPAGKCIYWFERTDMVKAYEVLGDIVALRGNLSSSLMTTGQPEEVDAAVKHLVDSVWNKGGNLILDCAFGLPDETPIPNVRAMFDAARKYAG